MLIPINTDAPLYHFPYGTIALIVINTACFLLTGCAMDDERLGPWMLEYGNGINPLEWLSSMFAHGGFGHLIGNMFFLWGFGLVVEGKLGLRRFLMLYLGIGLLQAANVDLMTLHRTDAYVLKHVLKTEDVGQLTAQLAAELEVDPEDAEHLVPQLISAAKGRCLGASGAIFGLMAVALVWAPKNDMHIVGFLGFRPVSFEVSILWYSAFYIAINLLGVLLDKFEMGSSGLHMVGGIIGFVAGVIYLKRGWVDCENWDLFAVMSGKYGRFANENWALGSYAHTDKVYSEIPLPTESDGQTGAMATATSTAAPQTSAGNLRTRGAPALGATELPPVSNKNLRPIAAAIDSGDFMGAADLMIELRLIDSTSMLDQERLRNLCSGLLQANAGEEAEIYLEEYIERFAEDSSWAKIRLAHLLLTDRQRPAAAAGLLKTLRVSQITERQKNQAKKLLAAAKKQIQAGVQDVQPEW